MKNIYWKCHNHRCLHRWIESIDILPRDEKYLLKMPQSLTSSHTDSVRRHFTESWKILLDMPLSSTKYIRRYISSENFFGVHFPSVKPSVIFFFADRLSDEMWDYRRKTCRRTLFIGKKFTDEVWISYWRIWSVGKTIKSCSEFDT
jgi:hypothetical protein